MKRNLSTIFNGLQSFIRDNSCVNDEQLVFQIMNNFFYKKIKMSLNIFLTKLTFQKCVKFLISFPNKSALKRT